MKFQIKLIKKLSKLMKKNYWKKSIITWNTRRVAKKYIEFSKGVIFRLFFCCKRLKSEIQIKKEKLFTTTESKIPIYLDVLNYTKLYEEFEENKSLILDPYQLNVFEFTKSRNISNKLRMDSTKEILESVKTFKEIER